MNGIIKASFYTRETNGVYCESAKSSVIMGSDSTATNKSFEKLLLVKFGRVFLKIHNYLKRLLKNYFQLHMHELRFSSYTSNKPINYKRLNKETDRRIQLSSIKADIKKTYKNVK